jgi:hypothetical protein
VNQIPPVREKEKPCLGNLGLWQLQHRRFPRPTKSPRQKKDHKLLHVLQSRLKKNSSPSFSPLYLKYRTKILAGIPSIFKNRWISCLNPFQNLSGQTKENPKTLNITRKWSEVFIRTSAQPK